MIRYLFGEDIFSARSAISALAKSSQAQLRFVDEADIADASVERILDSASAGLFGKTLLVVRDAVSYNEAIRDSIVEYCTNNSSASIVFWHRGNPDARLTLHKFLKKTAEVSHFPALEDIAHAMQWITAYVHSVTSAGSIARDAMQSLIHRAGFDTYTLASEIQKLLAYHASITREDVERIVPERSVDAGNAFPLLEAMSVKNAKASINILQSMISAGSSERFILFMIAYQYRLLLTVHMGVSAGMNVSAIAKASKLHPTSVQKTISVARRYSLPAIHIALARIAGAERVMNTTKIMDERSMVTMLVSGLTA